MEYLRIIANEKEVQNYRNADKDLITALDQYAEQGQFNAWKLKVSLFQIVLENMSLLQFDNVEIVFLPSIVLLLFFI